MESMFVAFGGERIFLAVVLIMLGVDFGVLFPGSGQVTQNEDCGNRTHGNTQAAIDARRRINERALGAGKLRLINSGMDAIDGANIQASRVFPARLSNDKGHTNQFS